MKRSGAFLVGICMAACALFTSACSVCEHSYFYEDHTQTHFLKCEKCGQIQEESKEAHLPIDVEANSPDETEAGHEMGKICSICKRVLEGCKIIPATTPFVSKTFGTLNYCEYKPTVQVGRKVPLVLFLHGAGERGDNNKSQVKHAITQVVKNGGTSPFMNAVVLAPQCPKDSFWTNADHAKGAYSLSESPQTEILSQVMELVRAYLAYDYVDENRVYVLGMSMGGYATWELLARYPDVFAAGVPICGGGPLDRVDVLKEIPIYVFHGKKDPLVPYCGSEDTVNAILAAGGSSVYFKTYENGYHDIWNKAITFAGEEGLPALDAWLFSQRKR